VLGAFSQSFDLPADLPLAAFSWPFEYAPRDNRLLAAPAGAATVRPPIDSSSPPSGTLVGVLLDESGHAVASAAVSLAGTTYRRRTDASGGWRMGHLFSGAYVVHLRHIGYAPLDTTLVVRRGPGVTQDTIRVTRIAERLAVVTVTGHNMGRFVVPMMSTVVRMTLSADGSLRGTAIAASSASGVADTAVLTAVRRAATGHPFPRVTSGVRDTAAAILDLVVSMGEPPPGDQTMVVRRLDAPTWPSRAHAQLDSLPDLTKDLAHRAPRADTVALAFVVNEHGRPLASTARPDYPGPPLAHDYKDRFARRLIRFLSDFQFNEAYVSGCAVPQFIRRRFGYLITPQGGGRVTKQSWSSTIP
jgi:hypothetical protein